VALMKIDRKRLAPLGLVLAGVAALAAIVLFIIQREWNVYLQVSLGLLVLGLALFAILDPARVRTALRGRQARYGSNTLVMTIAFLGIVVVIAYLAYQNNQRWDLTEGGQNTLAQETLDTLTALPESVQVKAFYSARLNSETTRSLLDQYKFNGNDRFNYQIIDPVEDPIAAQEAEITQDGTVVLQMGDRQETLTFVTEKELTGALVRLIGDEQAGVYFLTGHGEKDPTGSGDSGYSQLQAALESKNYKINTLNLLATGQIPADARVIVVAGPTKPVTSGEVDKFKEFIANGGALVIMEEPLPVTEFGTETDYLAAWLQESIGIVLGKDIVVDLTSEQPFVAWAFQYGNQPITEKMQGVGVYFPTARSVAAGESSEGYTLTELVLTADQTWAETDLAGLQVQDQQIAPDEGIDLIGSVPLSVAAASSSGLGRLVVFGDSDFATNVNFASLGNGDLLINAIDWAAEQEELINLTPKEAVQRVIIAPQRYTMGLMLFGSVILLPAIVLVAGGVVWFQRRKRG